MSLNIITKISYIKLFVFLKLIGNLINAINLGDLMNTYNFCINFVDVL